jgi:hypothetical protein
VTGAVQGRIGYLRNQVEYHHKQIAVLTEELEELMSRDEYDEKLDRHSYASRIDPLRDAAHQAVMAWMAEDDLEKQDLSERFWDAMAELAAVLVERKRGEPVPDVEVTTSQGSSRSSSLVAATVRPPEGRRGPAKNRSEPRYQKAFIEEARGHMGAPDVASAQRYLGKYVKLTFNVDWHPAKGVLTGISDDDPPYLLLDDYHERRYPLYTIQSIEELAHAPGGHPSVS